MANKKSERAYLEMARNIYGEFPLGIFYESESPDFLWPEQSFGVEVQRIFQPYNSTLGFSPSEIEGFQKNVVKKAEEIYCQRSGKPVDVTVYFSSQRSAAQRSDKLAGEISELVHTHLPGPRQVVFLDANRSNVSLPPSVQSITIAEPLPGSSRAWFGGGVGETKLLTRDLLCQAINGKVPLFRSYQARASKIWLLIVSDLFPSSMSFIAPEEIREWQFIFPFDKVLFLSREQQMVWSLKRDTTSSWK